MRLWPPLGRLPPPATAVVVASGTAGRCCRHGGTSRSRKVSGDRCRGRNLDRRRGCGHGRRRSRARGAVDRHGVGVVTRRRPGSGAMSCCSFIGRWVDLAFVESTSTRSSRSVRSAALLGSSTNSGDRGRSFRLDEVRPVRHVSMTSVTGSRSGPRTHPDWRRHPQPAPSPARSGGLAQCGGMETGAQHRRVARPQRTG